MCTCSNLVLSWRKRPCGCLLFLQDHYGCVCGHQSLRSFLIAIYVRTSQTSSATPGSETPFILSADLRSVPCTHTHPGMEWLSMVFSDLEERRLSNMIHIYGCSVALGNYCGLLLTARADTEMCITHLVVVALFLIFRALEI